jgi:hypothetical protein
LPFKSGDEAEIVEHRRPEKKRDVADGFDGGFGDRFYVPDLGLRDLVIGWNEFGELADFDEEGTEGLADFVVEFAGNGAALFFLSFYQTSRQSLEFQAAEGERLITLASLALEAEDVPAADERHKDAGK